MVLVSNNICKKIGSPIGYSNLGFTHNLDSLRDELMFMCIPSIGREAFVSLDSHLIRSMSQLVISQRRFKEEYE